MENKFPEIFIHDLTVGYHSKEEDKRLIKGFTTQLKSGEIIALMGSNGSGKSTLLRTLAGFQHPLGGEVKMNGKVISAISMKERAKYISYVSTETVRVGNMSVFDLAGLGRYLYSGWWGNLSKEDIDFVNHCLDLTGMKAFAHREVNSLSDGERQRVMIARALVQDTPIIILDEPTAFLDVRNKYEIIHLLRELAVKENKSVIFSSHDLSITMGMADKVWLIEKNSVVEGAPEDLALQGSYKTFFEGSPMTFIAESGEIVLARNTERSVNIDVEGTIRDWLTKALLRNGFVHDIHSPIKVGTSIEKEHTFFTLENEKEILRFNSIYELMAGLKVMGR
jgi:iron complex transport system ATP-binding protein